MVEGYSASQISGAGPGIEGGFWRDAVDVAGVVPGSGFG